MLVLLLVVTHTWSRKKGIILVNKYIKLPALPNCIFHVKAKLECVKQELEGKFMRLECEFLIGSLAVLPGSAVMGSTSVKVPTKNVICLPWAETLAPENSTLGWPTMRILSLVQETEPRHRPCVKGASLLSKEPLDLGAWSRGPGVTLTGSGVSCAVMPGRHTPGFWILNTISW